MESTQPSECCQTLQIHVWASRVESASTGWRSVKWVLVCSGCVEPWCRQNQWLCCCCLHGPAALAPSCCRSHRCTRLKAPPSCRRFQLIRIENVNVFVFSYIQESKVSKHTFSRPNHWPKCKLWGHEHSAEGWNRIGLWLTANWWINKHLWTEWRCAATTRCEVGLFRCGAAARQIHH